MKSHLPCPICPSTDAYTEYSDHGYCFSCKTYIKNNEVVVNEDTYEYLPRRGISKEVHEFYGAKTRINSEGIPIQVIYPYPGWEKVRLLQEKEFFCKGPVKPGLFGLDKFAPGSAKEITITEGEDDAMSVREMLGRQHPVVSVRSGGQARVDCVTHRDALNSFDRIYLCLDNDRVGADATQDVARLFDPNKVYFPKFGPFKDANEFLSSNRADEFRRAWHNAAKFLPEGVVGSWAAFDDIIDNARERKGYELPFPTLQSMTGGLRPGENFLIKGLEGIGKTEIIRSFESHILRTTDVNIACIHLEETKDRQLKGLAGHELHLPAHIPGKVHNRDIKEALRRITRRDERLYFYSHFGSDDPNVILDIIRHLVTVCNCKIVFLDHINMVVSGLMEEDERKAIDMLVTRLAMMQVELDFHLCFVAHVNDFGQTRSSRMISKIANTVLHLDRDVKHENEFLRRITHLTLEKNRFMAGTGPAGRLLFHPDSYTLSELDEELPA